MSFTLGVLVGLALFAVLVFVVWVQLAAGFAPVMFFLKVEGTMPLWAYLAVIAAMFASGFAMGAALY